MKKSVLITEKQFRYLVETGAANAAMDLDIYVQPIHYDTSNGNEGQEQSLDNIIEKLKEISFMLRGGKKIDFSLRNKIFKFSDDIDKIYNSVKTQ